MPVTGLPTTLECMLNTALTEMKLSSFKVESRGNNTVVVLRLTTDTTATSTSAAAAAATTNFDSQRDTQMRNQSSVFRRKCPSQIDRDRRRAGTHRHEQERKARKSASSTSGFLSEDISAADALGCDADTPTVASNKLRNTLQETDSFQCDRDTQTETVDSEEKKSTKLCEDSGSECVMTNEDIDDSESEVSWEEGEGSDLQPVEMSPEDCTRAMMMEKIEEMNNALQRCRGVLQVQADTDTGDTNAE